MPNLSREIIICPPGDSFESDVVVCGSNSSRGEHQVKVVRKVFHFTEKHFFREEVFNILISQKISNSLTVVSFEKLNPFNVRSVTQLLFDLGFK